MPAQPWRTSSNTTVESPTPHAADSAIDNNNRKELEWSLWYARMQKSAHRFQVVTGKAYRPRLLALGRAKLPVWCLIGLYLSLSILLPLLVLVWASVLPYFQLPSASAFASASLDRYWALPWNLVGDGLVNTLILMVLTPTATLALSLCFSWVVLRTQLRGRAWLDFIAFLPHAMPNIVFGIGALLLALFVIEAVVEL